MLIQCTNCQARYMVPDQSIGVGGRTVRCAKCAHSWFVATPAVASDAKPASEPDKPRPIPHGSNLPVIKHPTVPLGAKAATFGLMAAAIAVLLLLQWPQTYGNPRSKGFALAEVGLFSRPDEKNPENKRPLYEINGKILNTSGTTLPVPVLRVTLVDAAGEKLQYWDFSEKGATLESKKTIPFSTGPLDIKFTKPSRFVVELGSPLELSLRRGVHAVETASNR